MSNSDNQAKVDGPQDNEPSSLPVFDLPESPAVEPAEVETVTLAVESPFYYSSVILPDGEDGTVVIERTGTEVLASEADEIVAAASAIGVTLSRSE